MDTELYSSLVSPRRWPVIACDVSSDSTWLDWWFYCFIEATLTLLLTIFERLPCYVETPRDDIVVPLNVLPTCSNCWEAFVCVPLMPASALIASDCLRRVSCKFLGLMMKGWTWAYKTSALL